jgi:fumarate reductase flavoprotein subunit
MSETRDIVVAGGGMAGLAAALAAAEHGAGVLVLEKSDRVGGNALLSAGMFLGAASFEAMRGYIPEGDAALQSML